MRDQLRGHLLRLELPPAAAGWLLDLWDAIQALDDLADGALVDPDRLRGMIYTVIAGLPGNPFFQANSTYLAPVLAQAVLKWKASDDAERAGAADARSYMWRASYYDVVLSVVMLCHGAEAAMRAARHVLEMYGETYDEYQKEFSHA